MEFDECELCVCVCVCRSLLKRTTKYELKKHQSDSNKQNEAKKIYILKLATTTEKKENKARLPAIVVLPVRRQNFKNVKYRIDAR